MRAVAYCADLPSARLIAFKLKVFRALTEHTTFLCVQALLRLYVCRGARVPIRAVGRRWSLGRCILFTEAATALSTAISWSLCCEPYGRRSAVPGEKPERTSPPPGRRRLSAAARR